MVRAIEFDHSFAPGSFPRLPCRRPATRSHPALNERCGSHEPRLALDGRRCRPRSRSSPAAAALARSSLELLPFDQFRVGVGEASGTSRRTGFCGMTIRAEFISISELRPASLRNLAHAPSGAKLLTSASFPHPLRISAAKSIAISAPCVREGRMSRPLRRPSPRRGRRPWPRSRNAGVPAPTVDPAHVRADEQVAARTFLGSNAPVRRIGPVDFRDRDPVRRLDQR